MVSPVSYSGSLVVGDAVTILTDEQYPIKSINLIPNQYRVRCIGWNNKYDSEFFIIVPETNGGTVNASDITTGSFISGSWITMSYAVSASYAFSASYASTSSVTTMYPDIYDDGEGNVGIATNNPNYTLDVNGSIGNSNGVITFISPSEMLFSLDENVITFNTDNEIFNAGGDYFIGTNGDNSFFNANGNNVGVGTNLPLYALDVNGDIGNSNGDLTLNASTGKQIVLNTNDYVQINGQSSTVPYLLQLTRPDGDQRTLLVSNGSSVGSSMDFQATYAGGHIWSFYSLANGAGQGGGKFLIFDTTAGGTRMTIDTSGNIGINEVTNPLYRMDINGAVGNSSNGNFMLNDGITSDYLGHNNSYVNGNGLNNFGVGTNNPLFELDVNGSINTNAGYYLNGSPYTASLANAVNGSVIATTLAQLPISSSIQSLTPVVSTGSAYFRISSTGIMLLFAYDGTRWHSSSLA